MSTRSRKWPLEIIGLVLSAIVIVPLLLIVFTSFKGPAEAADFKFSLPTEWYIYENYTEVLKVAKVSTAFWNSLIITGSSVFLVLVVCCTSAFVIQRRKNFFTNTVQFLLLAGMVLPLSIITTYMMLFKLGLTQSTYVGLILVYVATSYPIITFLYIGFFNSLSREIDEAAVIDGAKGYGLFFRVIFPLLKPMNATAIILTFISVWNDFATAIYFLNSAKKYTLGITVFFFQGEHSSDWNLVFADLVIVSIPVIIVYIVLQKQIISGLTAGAVKS
ncbi:carbohydrate ABC transporter permease [Cohnella soli]|uniref:Carbohydrate ABC transporter permease n=1 Tax=Cohnella soli TaxID=425005 RepID=A0ABW0HUT5_9BACL